MGRRDKEWGEGYDVGGSNEGEGGMCGEGGIKNGGGV